MGTGGGGQRTKPSRRTRKAALLGLTAALIVTDCTEQLSGTPAVDSTPSGFATQIKQICSDDGPKFEAAVKVLNAATDPRPGLKSWPPLGILPQCAG
jgi:hypothetical protein